MASEAHLEAVALMVLSLVVVPVVPASVVSSAAKNIWLFESCWDETTPKNTAKDIDKILIILLLFIVYIND